VSHNCPLWKAPQNRGEMLAGLVVKNPAGGAFRLAEPAGLVPGNTWPVAPLLGRKRTQNLAQIEIFSTSSSEISSARRS
jgi:hypothetical protein